MVFKAYAKINLALEVMDLKDGYHMVNNLMVLTNLYDEITLEKCEEIKIIDNNIPDNIMIKAANLFLSHFNINSGVLISIKKNIPVAAGLAGGSTDAACVLTGLNELYNVGATKEELMLLASKLGSDVPYFISGGLSLCTNRGEIVNKIDIKFNKIRLALIKINEGLSTALVYKNYNYDGISKTHKIDNIIDALNKNDISKLKENIFNDLTSPALSLNNNLLDLYNRLNKITKIYLSGSGPTLFGLDLSDEEVKEIRKELDKSTFFFDGYIEA